MQLRIEKSRDTRSRAIAAQISPQATQLSKTNKSAKKEMEKSLANVKAYSSLSDAYDDEEIVAALDKTGGVKGHHSGKPGDGMNSATQQGLKALSEQLKKDKQSSKANKKKPTIKGAQPMGNFEKALVQAQTTYKGELGDFIDYLERKGWEFSEAEELRLFDAVGS